MTGHKCQYLSLCLLNLQLQKEGYISENLLLHSFSELRPHFQQCWSSAAELAASAQILENQASFREALSFNL